MQLIKNIKVKHSGKHIKGVLLHQDNASVDTSVILMAAINNSDFELIQHPPYLPYLAPSDFIYSKN